MKEVIKLTIIGVWAGLTGVAWLFPASLSPSPKVFIPATNATTTTHFSQLLDKL